MPRDDFVHLHLHSQYSLLDGAIRIPELVTRAKEYGMNALAITDHGNLFGAMEFYTELQAKGIKPIIGCEVYVAPRSRTEKNARTGEVTAYHLVLLCQNEKGYRNLCSLVSQAYLEGFYYKPRVDKELLEERQEGLIALSACLSGEIPSLLQAGDDRGALAAAAWYRDVFGPDRFYLELQENRMTAQHRVNEALVKLAGQLGIGVVATNDCHYLDKTDHDAHDTLLCIQTGKQKNDVERMRFETEEFYFKSPAEMIHDFRHVPEAIENSLAIAEQCSLLLEFDRIHMPRFALDTGETLRERFEKDARAGLEVRLSELSDRKDIEESEIPEYRERLDREIKLIQEMQFSGYFLIVADFINYARNNGIPVGPGRGSAAGSLAAYCLGITDVDPLRYDLLFERFLNPERKSMPDIDVDFCMDGRDMVIDYVAAKYGKESVAQIITFGRMQARAVVRDVARVLGMPYPDADRIAKLIPDELKIRLDDALEKEPKLQEEMDRDPAIERLIGTARRLEGLTRHASTHAAGIVISDRPLQEHLPLYRGAKGETLTQFDMTWVERIGLVKFDFLGLKTLTVIDRALRLLKESSGRDLDLSRLPLNDAATYALLSKGDALGVFQLESSGMRDMLVKFKPSTFEDLIAILALYRPGPMKSGMVDDFINRKHGRTTFEFPLPQLEPILKSTYGVIVYQEQVMNIATTLAGYSLGEADLLRRAMGKKKLQEMAKQKDRFQKGAAKNKVDPEKATYIFELMEKFAGYGFNKSHSTAYALLSYQTAYLKAHHAAEFLAAQLTCESGNTEKVTTYIAECRDRNIGILPPHVNASASDFHVQDGKVIFGLSAVKNVGEGAIKAILEAREKGGPFCHIHDFAERVDLKKVNKKVIESLIKCGAFDGFGHTRRAMADALDSVIEAGHSFQKDKAQGQFNLFDQECFAGAASAADVSIPPLAEWEELIKLAYEKEMLGFYVTGHPLMKHESLIRKYTNANSLNLPALPEASSVRMAGLVKKVKVVNTKRGDRMAFLSLEDLTGIVEITVFSDLYGQKKEVLQEGEAVMVAGAREANGDGSKILANDIVPLEEAPRHYSNGIHVRLSTTGTDPDQIKSLARILRRHRGRLPVKLHVTIPRQTETIINLNAVSCDPSAELLTDVEQAFGYQPITFE